LLHSASRFTVLPAALAATTIGLVAAATYAVWDLTLSHYDAKAHLVVARRILDSLDPGWMQIGAVWLPLPHLLNALPAQSDWLYRTGASAVALSVFGFVLGATSLWWLVRQLTGSSAAAWAAFTVFSTQPDVLFLQATPMTESLLMGLVLFGVTLTWVWVDGGAHRRVWPAGMTLALACLTRFEAWPITLAVICLAAAALAMSGISWRQAAMRAAALASYPTAAVLAFLLLSRVTVGAWLVTDGFFEIDPATYHRPLVSVHAVLTGFRSLNGTLMVWLSGLAVAVILAGIARRRVAAAGPLFALALMAAAVLPLYAFWSGHPIRVRYMVHLTMPLAVAIGLGVGPLPRSVRGLAAAGVMVTALAETPPLSRRSPMVLEAQWDRPHSIERKRVTECLAHSYDRAPILASMGSLAHYMHETSSAGISIRDYIHEGIGTMWTESLISARRHAGWVLVEERAEGGDALARLRDRSPEFLDGFERVCDGGGVTLYRRIFAE
jgi:hypothetical protein